MSLQALLAGIDPDWYRSTDPSGPFTDDALEPRLLQDAQESALGQRMLARWLLEGVAPHLFAPRADGGNSRLAQQWPRERLSKLIRDLGVLAHAPAIRSEVGREPVRMLKRTLGNSYLLALDKAVWDGRVDKQAASHIRTQLNAALAEAASDDAALHAVFDRQGRHELRAWAASRDSALGDWVMLQWPQEVLGATHLPEKQVLFLYTHHEQRVDAH